MNLLCEVCLNKINLKRMNACDMPPSSQSISPNFREEDSEPEELKGEAQIVTALSDDF